MWKMKHSYKREFYGHKISVCIIKFEYINIVYPRLRGNNYSLPLLILHPLPYLFKPSYN